MPASRARWFSDALRHEGVSVVEVGDWSRRNRDHKGPWYGDTGVMIHHTASTGTQGSVSLCRYGRSDLPGPLCHGVIAKDGTVYLVGYGRANHAGLGDSAVLRALKEDRKKLPAPRRWDTDGNRHYFGFECVNEGTGKDPWPAAQMDAIVRVSAALCRSKGWSADRVVGHKEWQRGKIDPKGFSMATLRSRISKRLTS
ncbi:N-acetylmuramoyl-L-alanine amidase [Streptomyces solisilvae]|uniref:peptidoglycan recognition protein family protein n=1 Tax=Streptomyces malaysiensis TaxID=92644 RepID=UPI0036B0BDE1